MRKTKKAVAVALTATMAVAAMTGCGKSDGKKTEGFDTKNDISVLTRESGSGTRGAFIELFGIEEKNADGKKVDNTVSTAEETNSTAVMITTVQGDDYSIGYISLGALNKNVKALKVDGVEATAANVKNGTYKVARPFNVAVQKDTDNEAALEFIKYVMSADGQKIINEEGYIGSDDGEAYVKTEGISGKIVIGGSSSVTPVMEKLTEAYGKVNSDIQIELQQSDSTSGMTNTIEGSYDIGMASRELKDDEAAKLDSQVIAMDGIAVIVNNNNTLTDITSDQVKSIYTGSVTTWADIIK